ncbi:MAG: gamma-glutamyltransferase [Deltaproteobacteria bacterium]|jgi:gamma-glutamyltranspeptidase/glutathione hydrolase|nr:gamma-glutamyltransferase [Deltaproteobacteria bacterium]
MKTTPSQSFPQQNRPVTMAPHGLVASPHYLASQAGVDILKKGGTAVDAAIATNAVLNVVYPHMCGIGGDAFWLIYSAAQKDLAFLNASGRSPYLATLEYFQKAGMDAVPLRGLLPVTIPGAVDGWFEAHHRYGNLSMSTILEPAIAYARDGYPISHILSFKIQEAAPELSRFPSSQNLFLPGGKSPGPGDLLTNLGLAESLAKIARDGRDVFYQGEIARQIVKFSQENGGLLSEKDFQETKSTWGKPVSTTYRDYTVYETAPNSQGLAALLILNLLEEYDLSSLGYQSPDHLHLLVEAKKLAFADRNRYISDPERVKIPTEELLSKDYAARRRSLIHKDRAAEATAIPAGSFGRDTIYLCVIDEAGNAVSLIQSLYFSFGSAVVAGETGIVLQNRGAYFSLDPNQVNCLQPHKRTFHTLMASMTFREGKPYMIFGTSGADGQPQTHVQVMTNVFDFGLNIQSAIEAPRWLSGRYLVNQPEGSLTIEGRVAAEVIEELKRRGHQVNEVENWSQVMGSAHGIIIHPENGLRMGGSDPRSDGAAIGY